MHPQFDYVFELFTLLISLAVAEMLMGFSRILKMRARRKAGVDPTAISVRVGWLHVRRGDQPREAFQENG